MCRMVFTCDSSRFLLPSDLTATIATRVFLRAETHGRLVDDADIGLFDVREPVDHNCQ